MFKKSDRTSKPFKFLASLIYSYLGKQGFVPAVYLKKIGSGRYSEEHQVAGNKTASLKEGYLKGRSSVDSPLPTSSTESQTKFHFRIQGKAMDESKSSSYIVSSNDHKQ